MFHAIELYLDPGSEAAIVALQARIARRLDRPDLLGRPHLTLGACEHIHLEPDDDPLAGIVAAVRGEPVAFSSLGQFSGERSVLFLAPVVTVELLSLHQRVSDTLDPIASGWARLYRPGSWVPHCTLAMDLALPDLAVAMEIAAFSLPLATQIASIEIVRYPHTLAG